jgi:hypothetical protein
MKIAAAVYSSQRFRICFHTTYSKRNNNKHLIFVVLEHRALCNCATAHAYNWSENSNSRIHLSTSLRPSFSRYLAVQFPVTYMSKKVFIFQRVSENG